MRIHALTHLGASTALTLALTGAGSGAAESPNVLFILTDDQGPRAVGVEGNSHVRTPHLDRLFRGGAHLRAAFVTTPVCSPSRATLLTSRHGSELGITDWINPRSEPEVGLDPAWPVWPRLLAEAGYHTGLVGKWHLGTADRFHPTRFGYQEFAGFREGGTKVRDAVLEVDGEKRACEGLTVDVLTDLAIDFVRRQAGRRFLLSLHYRSPHAPWLPVHPDDLAPYDGVKIPVPDPTIAHLQVERIQRFTREYYASVSGVDRNVGRLLDLLEELELTGRTVVIFTSDHGYNVGEHGLWYKGNAYRYLDELPPQETPDIPRDRRPNLFDTSLRSPTAVRWPGVVRPGTVVTRTVTFLDWFPTLLEIAGVELPADTLVRGRSIVPLLRGDALEGDDGFYCEYSMHHGARVHLRAWRTPEWKLVRDFLHPGRDELYHLAEDPGEQRDLARQEDAASRQAFELLNARLQQAIDDLGDPGELLRR